MNSAEHKVEANRLLKSVAVLMGNEENVEASLAAAALLINLAQVHATLATVRDERVLREAPEIGTTKGYPA